MEVLDEDEAWEKEDSWEWRQGEGPVWLQEEQELGRRWPHPEGTPEQERLRQMLHHLWMEKRENVQRLKKLDSLIYGSDLEKRNAHRRARKQQELLKGHRTRAADFERKICQLQGELVAGPASSAPLPGDCGRGKAAEQRPQASVDSATERGSEGGLGGASLQREELRPWALTRTAFDRTLTLDAQQKRPGTSGSAGGGGVRHSRSCSSTGGVMGKRGSAIVVPETLPKRTSTAPQAVPSRSSSAPAPQREGRRRHSTGALQKAEPSAAAAFLLQMDKPKKLTELEEEGVRMDVRNELVRLAGGCREAFQMLDLNKSGNVSLMEFTEGVSRMGLKLAELCPNVKLGAVFRLLDGDRDGVLSYRELFPDDTAKRAALPDDAEEFGALWLQQDRHFSGPFPTAKWQPRSSEEELEGVLQASEAAADAAAKKKWMKSTIRRLKRRGKSDAKCRELVALHLPRGNGPKDLQDVKTFSHGDVRSCRKKYTDEWTVPMKKIQKVLVDMKDIKKDLQETCDELYMATEGRHYSRQEEERQNAAEKLKQELCGAGPLLEPIREQPKRLSAASQDSLVSAFAGRLHQKDPRPEPWQPFEPKRKAASSAVSLFNLPLQVDDGEGGLEDSDSEAEESEEKESEMMAYFRQCLQDLKK